MHELSVRFRRTKAPRRVVLGILMASVVVFAGLGWFASSVHATGPTTACTLQALDTPSNVGQSVRFRFFARVTSPPGPFGGVTFFDDGVPINVAPEPLTPDDLGTTDHSSVVFTTSGLDPGEHTITAVMFPVPPNTPCPPGQPNSVTQKVNSTQTNTSVSSSVNPSVFGQSVTFTAAVTKQGGTPTGTVQFQADGQNIGGPQPVDGGGHASVSTSTLSVGNHPITASFTSDSPNALNSQGTLAGGQQVNAAQTTTGVSSSANPSVFGQNVTFTAAVSVNSPGSGSPSGTVQFQADGQNFGGAQPVDGNGHASVSMSGLAAGNHPITATFTSNNANTANSQGSLNGGQQVNPAATTTSVLSSRNPSEFEQSVTLTASVRASAPGFGTPSGTVQFRDNGTDIGGPRALDGSGNVSFDTSALTVGDHTISAVFIPTTGNFTGSSGSIGQTVEKARTTLAYTGPAEGDYHDPATLSATLTRVHDSAPLAGRSIVLTLGTQSCSDATDASGGASCVLTPTQAPGNYTVKASFGGDAVSLASSDSKPFTVTKQESTTSLSATPSPSTFGQTVTLTASVAEDGPGGGTPTGSVVFTVDGVAVGSAVLVGGSASITTSSSLRAGSHTVTASYVGDAYYLGSSDVSTQAVTCDVSITGRHHSGRLIVTRSACITGSEINGDVIVEPGASLDLQSSTVLGDIDASRSPGTVRVCGSSITGRVHVSNASGAVIMNKQADATCGPNAIGPDPAPPSIASAGLSSTQTPVSGLASFAHAAKTVTVSSNGTFSYRFTASPLFVGTARFESDKAIAARTRVHRRRLELGRSPFQATATGRAKVTVKLSRANLRTLTKLKRLQVRLTVTIDGRNFATRFVLKAPKPKPKRRKR